MRRPILLIHEDRGYVAGWVIPVVGTPMLLAGFLLGVTL